MGPHFSLRFVMGRRAPVTQSLPTLFFGNHALPTLSPPRGSRSPGGCGSLDWTDATTLHTRREFHSNPISPQPKEETQANRERPPYLELRRPQSPHGVRVVPFGPGHRPAGGAGTWLPWRPRLRLRPRARGGPRQKSAQVGRTRRLRGPWRGEDYAAVAPRFPHRNSPAPAFSSARSLFVGLSLWDWMLWLKKFRPSVAEQLRIREG